MTKVTIAFLGTDKYFSFFPSFYANCRDMLLVDCDRQFLIFTDSMFSGESPENSTVYPTKHEPWPLITLKRFEILLRAEETISHSDFFLFLDADMLVVSKLNWADLFNNTHTFTGVQHPAFYNNCSGTFESNPKSRAYIAENADRSTYWQGCLWGGRSNYVIHMLKTLAFRVKEDLSQGIIAIWHDESHLNKFFIDNKNSVNTLDPGFAFPIVWGTAPFERKILHLAKNDEEFGNYGPSSY